MIAVPAGVSLNANEVEVLIGALRRLAPRLVGTETLLLHQLRRFAPPTGAPAVPAASSPTSGNPKNPSTNASRSARNRLLQSDSAHDQPRGTLTSQQAAAVLGITANGVRDLRRRGVLHAELVSRRWLFDATEIRARAKE